MESSWHGPVWELRCFEKVFGQSNPATEEDIEVIHVDLVNWGLRDASSGQPVPKETGILTASRNVKQVLASPEPERTALPTACRHFRCQVCLEKKQPPQPSLVTSAPPFQFNFEVGCDAFELVDAAGEKRTILSLVDSGTKYHVAARVAGGGVPGSKPCADMFSSGWLAPFGPPKFLVCDQGVHNRGLPHS